MIGKLWGTGISFHIKLDAWPRQVPKSDDSVTITMSTDGLVKEMEMEIHGSFIHPFLFTTHHPLWLGNRSWDEWCLGTKRRNLEFLGIRHRFGRRDGVDGSAIRYARSTKGVFERVEMGRTVWLKICQQVWWTDPRRLRHVRQPERCE